MIFDKLVVKDYFAITPRVCAFWRSIRAVGGRASAQVVVMIGFWAMASVAWAGNLSPQEVSVWREMFAGDGVAGRSTASTCEVHAWNEIDASERAGNRFRRIHASQLRRGRELRKMLKDNWLQQELIAKMPSKKVLA